MSNAQGHRGGRTARHLRPGNGNRDNGSAVVSGSVAKGDRDAAIRRANHLLAGDPSTKRKVVAALTAGRPLSPALLAKMASLTRAAIVGNAVGVS